jgi:spore coat polysaccharide biosynthesis protein SpsF (cytidylyltransferase family)
MGSSRVPGKSLVDIHGQPVIERILRNVIRVRGLDAVCLATSSDAIDDPLAAVAKAVGVAVYRGDPARVLDRVHGAALALSAEVIVEIGGDCPFIGPEVLEEPIERFHAGDLDYLCNYEPPTYPEGFDVNIVGRDALSHAFERAVAPSQRIHPFSYLSFHRDQFRIGNMVWTDGDLSTYHWSLDYPEDVTFVRAAYAQLLARGLDPGIRSLIRLIAENAELRALHEALLRPATEHAFWNAPSILRDMHSDIGALAESASAALTSGDFADAEHRYGEVIAIAGELRACAQFRRNYQS